MNQKTEDVLVQEQIHDKENDKFKKSGGMNSVKNYLEDIWTEIDILKEKVKRLEKKQ